MHAGNGSTECIDLPANAGLPASIRGMHPQCRLSAGSHRSLMAGDQTITWLADVVKITLCEIPGHDYTAPAYGLNI